MSLEQLIENAIAQAAQGNYRASSEFWRQAYVQTQNDFCYCMTLEALRLLGDYQLVVELKRITFSRIINCLSSQQAESLVAIKIQIKNFLPRSDLRLILRTFGRSSDLVNQALAKHLLSKLSLKRKQFPELKRVKMLSFYENFSGETRVKEKLIPSFLRMNNFLEFVLGQKFIRKICGRSDHVREAKSLCIADACLVGGSDSILIEKKYYFDRIDLPNAEYYDPNSDPLIVAFDSRHVLLQRLSQKETRNFENAYWLAYPATQNWGHFFIECVLRLAYASQGKREFESKVILLENVPKTFENFITCLLPNTKIQYVKIGEVCQIRDVHILPATTFFPINLNYRYEGQELRWGNSIPIDNLRELTKSALDFHHDLFPRFNSKVYLNRKSGIHRRSENDTLIGDAARSRGFQSIDPGSLDPLSELNLFYFAEDIVGLFGSQFFLGNIAKDLKKCIIIAESHRPDFFYFENSFKKFNGIDVDILKHDIPQYSVVGENAFQVSHKIATGTLTRLIELLDRI